MEELRKNIEKFLPFLEDLRNRLFIGAILFVAFFVVGFLSTNFFVRKIIHFVTIENVTLTATSPFQYVQIAMDFGFFLATLVAVPYIIYSFYVFILPALTRSEKIRLFKSIPVSFVLFISGFFYGFFILFYALEVLATINTNLGVANFWNISQFLSQMLMTSALLGLVFEFPLLLSLFIMLGIITRTTLRKNRRIAYIALLFLAVLLPPTDIISLLGIVLPLFLLYEATILFNAEKQGYLR